MCLRLRDLIFDRLIAGVREFRVLADGRALEVEEVRYRAAAERNEREETARPLVPEAVVHLLGEEHDARAPERAQARLRGERAGRLVLVRVDEVVVRGVVEELGMLVCDTGVRKDSWQEVRDELPIPPYDDQRCGRG